MKDFLIQEIFEQPNILKEFIQNESDAIHKIADQLRDRFTYVVIAARGSSDNAARYAQYVLGAKNNKQVALATPSIFTIYKKPPDLSGALVIGVSQSGQSPDIVSVLETAKKQGQPTICITNEADSPLADKSDFIIPIHAGEEKSVAATKTYTTSLMAIAMLSAALNVDKDQIKELRKLPVILGDSLPEFLKTSESVSRYRYMEHCAVIGRGFNYATAFEIALKVKELTRVVAVPYSSADFKHGPIATVHTGFPVIITAINGPMMEHITEFTRNLRKKGAELIIISNNEELLSIGKVSYRISDQISEWLSPILSVVPGQLFARKLALEKGLDIDKPEGLTKVTETF